ncbi:MAG TPA: beta-ketoacyl-ACP synthase III [Actinomycetota bacterium]|nr:beta-ketoacyl-ACP synthase III [Actinomycetota bacterium]
MTGATVLGCGMAVPSRRVPNCELEATLDTDDAWIRRRTGIQERRVAAPNEATSTFAVAAAKEALDDAGVEAGEVDLVMVATCTPDYPMPGSAPIVQHELGATSAGAVDVNAGCTGFVSALALAAATVDSGQARTVVVCGAETMSRVMDWSDRRTAVLFGDGAGAVVVGRGSGGIGPFVQGSDGAKADWLLIPAGGSRRPADAESVEEHAHTVQMRGQDVYRHAIDRMAEAATAVSDPRDVDLLVAHQANGRIIEALGERLGLEPEQVVCNIARYGNTSAASIPIALAEAARSGRLRRGMRVLLVAFGSGFLWSAGVVRW